MTSKTRAAALRSACLALGVAFSLLACSDRRAGQGEGSKKKVDGGVAARVNGEPVTQAQLQRMLAAPLERQQLLQELGVPDHPGSKELDRLALRKLIHRRLILQEAGRRSFVVTEQDLDKAVTSLRRRFQDLSGLGAWMKEQGLDDQSLFETIRTDMLAARVRAALVEEVRVTDEEVQQYHQAHKEDLKTEEVWLQIIAVKEWATAEEIVAALRKGEDFGVLARQRSVGRRAAQGGDMGWVEAERLGPPLREAVGTLKAGVARGPLQRGNEFLIVRLQERRPGKTKDLAAARPAIERRLLAAKQQEAVQAWLTDQERKSKIEVLALAN